MLGSYHDRCNRVNYLYAEDCSCLGGAGLELDIYS